VDPALPACALLSVPWSAQPAWRKPFERLEGVAVELGSGEGSQPVNLRADAQPG
jgi:hypothetical protein